MIDAIDEIAAEEGGNKLDTAEPEVPLAVDSHDRSSQPEDTRPATQAAIDHRRTIAGPVAAALALPLAYIAYVVHFGVDVPQLLDWGDLSLIHAGLHGNLAIQALWNQYNESRIPVPYLIFLASGVSDHFNVKHLLILDAAIFSATFWLVLVLVRAYKQERLSTLNVVVLGMIWFSLADVQNPLLAFMLTWYVLLACLMMMAFLLLVPKEHRTAVVILAALAAVAGSFSAVQGFVLWPVGLLCLLWATPWTRRTYAEVVGWSMAGLATTAAYFHGFDFSKNGCLPSSACSIGFTLHHPLTTGRFLLALIGNVFPTGYLETLTGPRSASPTYGLQELMGALILMAALAVLFRSFRDRSTFRRIPLPPLLIVFSLLFIVIIALGRAGLGIQAVGGNNRFVMPSLLLVLGIAAYGIVYVKSTAPHSERRPKNMVLRWAVTGAFGTMLVCQVLLSTSFGLTNGHMTLVERMNLARLLTNLDRLPVTVRGCDLNLAVFYGSVDPKLANEIMTPLVAQLRADSLSVFQPAEYEHLRALGPPNSWTACRPSGTSTSHL